MICNGFGCGVPRFEWAATNARFPVSSNSHTRAISSSVDVHPGTASRIASTVADSGGSAAMRTRSRRAVVGSGPQIAAGRSSW